MSLPLSRDYPPMEASPAASLPAGEQWQYEPKWDGLRCLAFRGPARVDLQSKSAKPLTRYFPELAAALAKLKATKFVLDGGIVIPFEAALSFDQLLMRIHPESLGVKQQIWDPRRTFTIDLTPATKKLISTGTQEATAA